MAVPRRLGAACRWYSVYVCGHQCADGAACFLPAAPTNDFGIEARRKEACETPPAALYAVLDLCDASFDACLLASVLHDASAQLIAFFASQTAVRSNQACNRRPFGPLAATHAALCSFVAPQHQ